MFSSRESAGTRGEQGSTLTLALVAMMVGTLLVAPMLYFVSARYRGTEQYRQSLQRQYATDAGIEYALRVLVDDDTLRETLLDNVLVAQTLTQPISLPVNSLVPVLEVVCLEVSTEPIDPEPEYDWVMWAKGSIEISKNNTMISGDVHSGGPVNITGNNTVINGTVLSNTGVITYPVAYEIGMFRPGGSWAITATSESMYFQHAGDWEPSEADDMVPGLHYCTGDVLVDNNGVNGVTVTLVAEGTIAFTKNKNDYLSPYVPGLVFFSNSSADPAILIDGNKFDTASGIIFAPNGTVELQGNNATFTGATFMADVIRISKNDAIIQLPVSVEVPGDEDEGSGHRGVFDIRSTAGDRVTVARVRLFDDGAHILSWR